MTLNTVFEGKKISVWEKIGVVLLALCPILQHYKGLFVNASVTLLLIMFPFVVIKVLHKGRWDKSDLMMVAPLMLLFIYEVVAHGTTVTEAGQAVVFIVYFAAVAAGCLSTKYFVKAITAVAMVASICILIQYFCYYILGFHLQLVPTSLLSERSQQWVLLAQTGRISVTGKPISFYRPSSFFLEPSHMFLYMFTPLLISLLSPNFGKKERWVSILLTGGMVLSTSGMGILLTAGAWGLFLGKHGGTNAKFDIRKIFRPQSACILLLCLVVGVAMLIWVPFFRNSVLRIFSSSDDYKSAISGRVTAGTGVLKDLTGIHLWFGVSDNVSELGVRMAGFHEEMYRYGIIGTAVSYLFYVQGLLRLKNQFFWVSAVAIVMSFFSQHSHSSFFMLYSAFVFIEGYHRRDETVQIQRRTA